MHFDDGTLTLWEFEKQIKPKITFYRSRFLQDSIIKLRGCKPIGKLPQSKNLELFTLFDLGGSEFKCHPNELTQLKKNHGYPQLFNPDAPIGYIGQGAIGDKNQPSIQTYLDELKLLAEKLQKKILYFPHRTEKKSIKEQLLNDKNFIYHQSEYPLEIELIAKNIQLSTLIGNFSTVMFTCHLLYPEMPLYTVNDTHPDPIMQKILRKQLQQISVLKFYNYF